MAVFAMGGKKMYVAVIDVGTNAVRYLLAKRDGREWKDVDFGGVIVGLGRGLTIHGKLAPITVETTIGVVSNFVRRLKALGADKTFIVATEAVRKARNGTAFLRRIEEVTGVTPYLLTEGEEARFAFIGATSGLKFRSRHPVSFAVADVGGGSTEIAVGVQGRPHRWVSLPLGSRLVTESFFHDDPPTAEQLERAAHFLRRGWQPALSLLRDADVLLLSGGTACALGMLRLGLKNFDPDRIHGLPIRIEVLKEWLDRLAPMPVEERRKVLGMERGREQIIVAGLLIFKTLMELVPKGVTLISARAVLHGVLLAFVS